MNPRLLFRKPKWLYGISIVASLIISFFVNSYETVINPDAICYLYSAEEMAQSGLHQAMHLCPQAIWPFYSMLIFGFVQLTHLSFPVAAFVLDALFSAVSVGMFIAIVLQLGGSYRTGWFAAATILLAHHFNLLRQEIIRDHGFWCGYLISFYFLLCFFKQPRFRYALAWSASLVVATLFRIEGAIFLFGLPFAVWGFRHQAWFKRLRYFVMLHVPLWVILAGLLSYLLFSPSHTLDQLGRLSDLAHQWNDGTKMVADNVRDMTATIAKYVLRESALRDAGIVTGLLLVVWYFINLVNNISFIYAVLVIYAWATKAARLLLPAQLSIVSYMTINVMVTFLFFLENQFLAKRYLIALSLILMLYVPFALQKLFQRPIKHRIAAGCVLLLMIISGLGGFLHFGHSKTVIRDAGEWLSQTVPPRASLYVNDYQLMYYSNHFGHDLFKTWERYCKMGVPTKAEIERYDYFALLTNAKQNDAAAQLVRKLTNKPLKTFSNCDGDMIYVYHQVKLYKEK